MYSLILMSAMAGTPDVAAFGYGTGCAGSSASYSASYSYSYSSCGGCNGPAFPVLSGLAQGTRRFAGNAARFVASPFRSLGCYSSACYGSCYGSGYGSACYGSCYGSSSFGSACYGSCYGSGSGASCFGSAPVIFGGESYGAPMNAPVGEHYGTVCLSGAGTDTVVAARPTVTVEVAGDDKATASLSVELPAAAKLYVDGHLIAGGGEARQFHTPELPKGENYFYEMKAEIVVDGQVVVQNLKVVVRSGETIQRTFGELIAATAKSKPSEVAVK